MFRANAVTIRVGTVSAISEDGKIGNVTFDDGRIAMFYTDHGRLMKSSRSGPFFNNNFAIEKPKVEQRIACEWTGTVVRRWTISENFLACVEHNGGKHG